MTFHIPQNKWKKYIIANVSSSNMTEKVLILGEINTELEGFATLVIVIHNTKIKKDLRLSK